MNHLAYFARQAIAAAIENYRFEVAYLHEFCDSESSIEAQQYEVDLAHRNLMAVIDKALGI